MGIIHVRIDERLIHGQVANMWTNNLGISRIMVVDDNASNSDVIKMSLKMATPSGVALSVLNTARAVERIKSDAYKGQRVMLVVKTINTIVELAKSGVEFESINLGNLLSAKGDVVKVSDYVNLTKEDLNNLLWLRDRGTRITIRLIPTATEENFGAKIEKYLRKG